MATSNPGRPGAMSRFPTDVQKATLAVGAVFLLVGILGFIPGITTDYDSMTFAGHESGAHLLGIFEVSILHNLVHLAFGVAGLLLARTWSGARGFLIGGGAIYLLLWLYGLLIDFEKPINFVPVNNADNWLHFALGVGMVCWAYCCPGVQRWSAAWTPATPRRPAAKHRVVIPP